MYYRKTILALMVASLAACGDSSDKNSIPTFGQTSYQISTDEDQAASLTVSATDENSGDTVSYSLANAAANGTVDLNTETGEITYTPAANFFGEDSIEITATDGEDSSTVSVSVTVSAVNDLPQLDVSEVLVSGGETKKGQLEATDVDGDTLTYVVTKSTENGKLTVNEATGELTYTPTTLVDVNDSFTVVVTDGNGGELSKELTIRSNFATNSDRAFAYYASEQSHLKQAEKLVSTLSDDITQAVVLGSVAQGYAQAGLINQAESFLTEKKITRDETRARALLSTSNELNALGELDKANEMRLEAKAIYTQYVADKGIDAFDGDDADFYTDLARSYQAIGADAQASEVFGILDLLFKTSLDGNSSTSALLTFFGYRDLVEDAVEAYQDEQKEEKRLIAVEMADRMYEYANLISHRFVTNDRHGNEGKEYHSIRQVALSFVIEYFTTLNEFDKAKSALHDIFALHGVVGIDEKFPREADPFAEVTKVEYEYGLYGVLESFVVLYPEATLDVYLTGFPEGSFWALFAEGDAEDARLMAQVGDMEDKDAALQMVIAAKDDDDLRQHYVNLVAFNSSNPGGAIILRERGYYEAAGKFLDEALSLVQTPEYIAENLANEAFVSGQTGCELIVKEFLKLNQITGEATYLTKAQAGIEACISIVKEHFSEGVDGTDVDISDALNASLRFLSYKDVLDIEQHVAELKQNFETNLAKSQSDSDKLLYLKVAGRDSAYGANFTDAQSFYNRAITLLNEMEAARLPEERGTLTDEFFYDRQSSDYIQYLSLVDAQAGKLDNYTEVKTAAYSAWKTLIDSRLTALSELANQQKLTYLPIYAEHLIRLGYFDEALALAEDEALGAVKKNEIITLVATSLSTKDDFSSTIVASVDTDGDGKANFFLETATEEMITASGIELDLDSDNDGVNDDEDSFPLDPTKQ